MPEHVHEQRPALTRKALESREKAIIDIVKVSDPVVEFHDVFNLGTIICHALQIWSPAVGVLGAVVLLDVAKEVVVLEYRPSAIG